MNKFQKAIVIINETLERTVEDRNSAIALEYANLSYDIDCLEAMIEVLEILDTALTEVCDNSEDKINEYYSRAINEKFPKVLDKLFTKYESMGKHEADYVEMTRPRYNKILEHLQNL